MNSRSILLTGLIATSVGVAHAATPDDGDFAAWGLFGSGKYTVAFDYGGDDVDQAAGSVLGADGSLYIAGTVKDANGIQRMAVTKLLPNGGLDTAGFGGGDGKVTSPTTAGTMVATGIALRGTTLYVGGYRAVNATNRDFAVCAFSTGGVPLLFLNTGTTCVTASFDLGGISQDMARAIAVQGDGKIVLAGTTAAANATDTYAAFVRFNANGSLDNGFGLSNSGQQLLRNDNIFIRHRINTVAIASNGKIVAGGSTDVVGGNDTSGLLVRLNTDGSQDLLGPTKEYPFEVDGSNSRDTVVNDLILVDNPTSTEDDVVVVGYAEMSGTKKSGVVAKIKTATVLDTANFSAGDGSNGFDAVTGGDSLEFQSIAVQPGRGYVVGGTYFPTGAPSDFYVGRYLPSGGKDTLHPSVPEVQVTFDFGLSGAFDTLADVQVGGNGIYAVGSGFKTMTNLDFVAAKLEIDLIFRHDFD